MSEAKTNTFGSFLASYQSAIQGEGKIAGRELNAQAQEEASILNAIAHSGTTSVVELVRDTNLPVTRVVGLVDHLADAQLVNKRDEGGKMALELTDMARDMGLSDI